MVKMAMVFVAVLLATSAVMVEGQACYETQGDGTPIQGCTCHPSCATCGYNSIPVGEADCITCASTTDTLFPVYSDGTGTCGAAATVSSETQCSDWLTQLKSSAVSAIDMDTDAAGSTFEDQFRACQASQTGYYIQYGFPDGDGLCTDECKNLYDSVLPAARDAGRADCWQSRYYGVYYSMNCLTDQNGTSCGGQTGIFTQMQDIITLYNNEYDRSESGQFNKTHKFQSHLNQSTMATTCGSTCFQDGVFMMMEMNSNNGNAGQGQVDASEYDFLAAFGSYVCQEVSGEYCFPQGMTSMVNVFMNDPFESSINDLDTFCSVQDRCPKLSMAKYISIFEFMPDGDGVGPSNALMMQQFTELMEFDCMKHGTTYCLHALGGGSNDPPECGDGDGPDTSNPVCRSWLIDTINNGGCCIHAFNDLHNTMESFEPSDGGSGNGNKLMKELGGPEPVQQHDRKSIHRAVLNLAEAKLNAALAFKGWSPAAAKSQKQVPKDDTDECVINDQVVPLPQECENVDQAECCATGGPTSACPSACHSYASQCCSDGSSQDDTDECVINDQVVPLPQECENVDQAECCATGGPTSACPSACHSYASQCCSDGSSQCYDNMGDTTPVQGCTCHPSCGSCGYGGANGANDCIACADGSPVSQVYPDGTGNCGGVSMSVRGIVEAVGIDFDALPDACPVTKYKLPVELQFQEMLMETCVELISLVIKDIAASVGVVPDQVIGAECAQLTAKSTTGVKITGQVGVPTQDEANAMNIIDIQLSNTKAKAAKSGLALGSATVLTDTNNVVLATLTASPSPTASLSTGASPSNSPSGPAPVASSNTPNPTAAAAAVHAATTLALAAVGAALLWR